MHKSLVPVATALMLGLAGMTAEAGCLPVFGTVKLTTDTACAIADTYPDVHFDTSQCFTVKLKLAGILPGYGHAGVTLEPVLNAYGTPVAQGPVYVPVDGTSLPRQIIQTARSRIKLAGTELDTTEIIVIQADAPNLVTEQSIIVDAKGGRFAGVTGGFAVIGNSIGQEAQIRGEICRP